MIVSECLGRRDRDDWIIFKRPRASWHRYSRNLYGRENMREKWRKQMIGKEIKKEGKRRAN